MLKILILYACLMLTSMIFGVMLFPTWHEHAQIPLIPIVGLGSWIFGRRTGFLLILPVMIYSYCMANIIYPETSIYYEAKAGGAVVLIISATLIGNLRNNFEAIQLANTNLDRKVEERSIELVKLSVKLLDDVEATRIRHGQTLHDGIGQQLTGIQLYSTSLAEQLLADLNPSASLAFSMRARAEKAHNIIRKTARMLFPVRMQETGLVPAINELASCFNEMAHVSFSVAVDRDVNDIPDQLSLALYRICHESAMCAVTGLNASTIQLEIAKVKASYEVTLTHNGSSWLGVKENMEHRLILYRLKSLGGMFTINQSADRLESIIYRIPGFYEG